MTTTAPLLWLDGGMVRAEGASIPLMGHAAQRGSLVFDVGSFRRTDRGRAALFRARDHVRRFARSIGVLGYALSFDEDTLVDAATRAVGENGLEDGLVRWSAFLAAREPDLLPRDATLRIAVAAQSLDDAPRREPIRVAIFPDARKAGPDVLPADVKAAGAYLGPMLAKRRAVEAGADDVVLLDVDGDIAEAPIANAFAVIAGAIVTPPLGRVLPGITRRTVLELAAAEGIPVREERLPLATFLGADEAFLTSSSLPVAAIATINGRLLAGAPGPITTRMAELVVAARRGTLPARESWLTFVG